MRRSSGPKRWHVLTKLIRERGFVTIVEIGVKSGRNIDEIANEFKLGKMTVIQKRLSYNKASLEAGHPLNLPLPVSTGTRGGKKIDWAKFAAKVQESVNS